MIMNCNIIFYMCEKNENLNELSEIVGIFYIF